MQSSPSLDKLRRRLLAGVRNCYRIAQKPDSSNRLSRICPSTPWHWRPARRSQGSSLGSASSPAPPAAKSILILMELMSRALSNSNPQNHSLLLPWPVWLLHAMITREQHRTNIQQIHPQSPTYGEFCFLFHNLSLL